jgi:hypothetical protein
LRNLLKDSKGRYVPGALFDWELADELASPETDAERREALADEQASRQFHEARLRGELVAGMAVEQGSGLLRPERAGGLASAGADG